MTKISVRELIRQFRQMYEQHWSYVWGKAEKGCVDCSGAFVYAFRQFGISFPHGSNAIARRYTVGGMKPVSEARPGMAAFKAREPVEDRYDLPAKYRPGGADYNGDLTDYYHIGLVDDDPQYVLNAKGEKSGFSRDKITSGGWDFVAELKYVDYEKGDNGMKGTEAQVILPDGATGSTVNIRERASTDSPVLERVPVGNFVTVLEEEGNWCYISYGGRPGYMMTRFLKFIGISGEGTEQENGIPADGMAKLTEALSSLDRLVSALQEQVDVIASVIGRG